MLNFGQSMKAYGSWLASQIPEPLVQKDLKKKRKKMADGEFPFLRATYWRWAETILVDCPDLADIPEILSIGDTHLENFGTWRDAEGRLVWGLNDFDESAVMPYALDLVRLAASAVLAGRHTRKYRLADGKICSHILAGYIEGLALKEPVVLERERAWLRDALLLDNDQRRIFWKKLEAHKPKAPSPRLREALLYALPSPELTPQFRPRQAGTGSLGRPRFTAIARWQGGPVVREAKVVVQSAWNRHHRPDQIALEINAIAHGTGRAADPHYREADGILVRRLSPNSRKIEAEGNLDILLKPRMLRLMGREVGTCHAGDAARLGPVRDHAARQGKAWLRPFVAKAVARIDAEYAAFKRKGSSAQNKK